MVRRFRLAGRCRRDAEIPRSVGSPVIFFEPERLSWKRRQHPREVSNRTTTWRYRRAARSDITVVGYGVVLEEYSPPRIGWQPRIDVEVVDLRWIAPMDTDTVLGSVARTGRLLVAAWKRRIRRGGGRGGGDGRRTRRSSLEIAGAAVGGASAAHPPADYEKHYLVGVSDVVGAIEEMCG